MAIKLGLLLEKCGEMWGKETSFKQQSTVLVRLLKRRLLNRKAKRFRMGGCDKDTVKDRVRNLAGHWQENSPFVNLIGV